MTNTTLPGAYSSSAIDAIGERPIIGTLLEQITDGFLIVDESGRIVAVNETLADTYGYEASALIDRPFSSLIAAAQRDRYAASLRAFCETGEEDRDWSDLRLPGVHADGHELPIKVSLERSTADDRTWVYGTVSALSNQNESDTVHGEDDSQLSALIEEIKDYAIYKLDVDGRIRSWNPGAENIKGYTEAEVLDTHFRRFYTDEDAAAGVPDRNLEIAADAGRYEAEGWRVRADGSHFWARVLITPLWYDDGTLRGFAKITQDLTERHEQEEQLRQERELLDQVFNTAPMALTVNAPDGETLRANDRAAELFGLSKGSRFDDLVEVDQWRLVDGEGTELTPVDYPRAHVLETGEPQYNQELIAERPDGTQSWFSASAAPLFEDGEIARVVTAAEDITELKRLQQELEKERDVLKTELNEVLDRITESVFALDEEWRITYINENMEELLGRSEAELVGKHYWEEVDRDAPADLEDRYRTAMETQEPTAYEVEWEGDWFEVHLYPSETGVSVYFRNITERKQNKEALERAVDELEKSNAKLERFAYSASHDLQEPLRMISSYLQLLDQRYGDQLDEDATEFIDYAVDGAERMREMIEGLLKYSRVNRGDEEFERVDCNSVVELAIEHNLFEIENTGAEIAYDPLPTVDGSEELLVQLFQNLISNAIKYRGESPPEIEISGEATDDGWLFAVADNGIGMEPADSERIFDIFDRLHSSAEYSGTGIGLALCDEIVELHGGEIWVESEPGVGSTFYFTLAESGE